MKGRSGSVIRFDALSSPRLVVFPHAVKVLFAKSVLPSTRYDPMSPRRECGVYIYGQGLAPGMREGILGLHIMEVLADIDSTFSCVSDTHELRARPWGSSVREQTQPRFSLSQQPASRAR